jgi:uncharacterized protein YndB with AHSA1/START domain
MNSQSFTTTFVVDQTPEDVFAAITNVRGWWGDIEGSTDELGEEFTYRYQDLHYSRQKVTELIPGKKIVWHILDAYLKFTEDPNEWVGTDITFEVARKGHHTEVRFTHLGLVPEFECFDTCSSAWGFYVNSSLRGLITTGRGAPNPSEDRVGRRPG